MVTHFFQVLGLARQASLCGRFEGDAIPGEPRTGGDKEGGGSAGQCAAGPLGGLAEEKTNPQTRKGRCGRGSG